MTFAHEEISRMGSNALRPAARLRQSYHLPTCRKRGSHPKTKSTSNFGEASTPAGKVAVVGAGILIATSKVVVAGQSSGGDTTAVFGTGLVDVADWLRLGLRLRRRAAN